MHELVPVLVFEWQVQELVPLDVFVLQLHDPVAVLVLVWHVQAVYSLLLPQVAELVWVPQFWVHVTVFDEHVESVLQVLQAHATEEQAPLLEHVLLPQVSDKYKFE